MKKKINSKPLEIEEIFLDDLLKKREGDFELKERKIESPLEKKIFFIFSFLGALALFFLLVLTFNLQIIRGKDYKDLALANKYLNLKISAERGIIYDRFLNKLVSNEAKFELWFDNKEPISEKSVKSILEILGMTAEEINQKINESRNNPVLVNNELSHRELVLLESKISEMEGFKIKKRIKRNYIEENSFSHILGYLGKISSQELEQLEGYEFDDYIGKEGLEKEYEELLAEKKGVIEIERDAKGNEISRRTKENPSSGQNIVLSIDFALQKKTAEVLEKILVDRNNGNAAAAIILNPKNGEILTSVSLPSFDNNIFSKGISQEDFEKLNSDPRNPQLNRVIGGNYQVGSTIKPFLGLAGLEEKVIDENTTFFCPLDLCIENQFTKELECHSDWKFHGYASIKRAIAESINPFFYILGGGYERPAGADSRLIKYFEGLGPNKIAEWLKKFGWGSRTEVDLPGEVEGRVPDPEWKKEYFKNGTLASQKWYLGDTYNLSIGQGFVMVTPIQVASAYQAVINNGKIFNPKLIKSIISNDGKESFVEPEILTEVSADWKNFEIIREGMRQAIVSPEGSSVILNSLPVAAAAKTGTAQTGKEETYHNWITIFAPYENPTFLMVLMVESVKGTRVITQPAAWEILNWHFTRNLKDY